MPIPISPVATYRLQLSRDVNFQRARELISYFKNLGISHLYLSPLLAARPGSGHGYDVIDHSRVNPDYGTEEDLGALATAMAEADLGIIADLVPNHMCIDPGNTRWSDVLENGQASTSTVFFDIDWGPPKAELAGKVLLPVLGEQFGRELEGGAVKVVLEDGTFSLRYGDRPFPLEPRSWRLVLDPIWRRVRARAGDDSPQAVELESILRSLGHWPAERGAARARRHERDAVSRRIGGLLEDADVRVDFAAALEIFNGVVGEPRSFDKLEELVSEQHYRLAHWRVAAHEINYRRFFDVNELAAIRVENDDVFRAVHELPFRWAEKGWLTGFRIDHVDGLLEPERYLAQIRQRNGLPAGFYLTVEKILASGESLPEGWMTDGTTGYEHMAAVSAVLVDPENAGRLRELWRELTGQTTPFRDLVYEAKRLILDTAMVAELTVLAKRLDAVSEQHRYSRDFTFESLRDALREVIACFPAYRTYITRGATFATERDARLINVATGEAIRRNPVMSRSVFVFLEEVLLLRDPEGLDDEQRQARREFTLRFQQLTGPVTAKGVEDTAFYRFYPLASLAEVGGDPDRIGSSVDELHVINRLRAQTTPRSLSASATHDTKRGEDMRARLHVLSEIPELWQAAVLRWRKMNAPHRTRPAAAEIPDPHTDYLVYQSLVGGWPIGGLASEPAFPTRFKAYLRKANAEAKLHTSWINPNEAYEKAIDQFVDAILDPGRSAEFVDDVQRFVDAVRLPGFLNGLTQVLLKVASPGVPDIYRGNELWDFSYADPDNRRPVDFDARVALLGRVMAEAERDAAGAATTFLGEVQSGAVKMFVLTRALAARQARRAAFESARYEGCGAHGPRARHVIAFSRGETGGRVFAVAGRLFAHLVTDGPGGAVGEAWRDDGLQIAELLPNARYREMLTDRVLPPQRVSGGSGFALAEVFRCLPVALIEEIA